MMSLQPPAHHPKAPHHFRSLRLCNLFRSRLRLHLLDLWRLPVINPSSSNKPLLPSNTGTSSSTHLFLAHGALKLYGFLLWSTQPEMRRRSELDQLRAQLQQQHEAIHKEGKVIPDLFAWTKYKIMKVSVDNISYILCFHRRLEWIATHCRN